MASNLAAAPPFPPIADLITRQEAARIVGVHLRTIDRWCDNGMLHAYRVGPRLVRVSRTELERIVSRG